MAKYLVETYYNCTFKVSHYLDEINDSELKNLEKRNDGKFEIIDVKLDNRKTKNLDKVGNVSEINNKDNNKLDLASELKASSVISNFASKIPSEWYSWMHFTSNKIENSHELKKFEWQKPHKPNLTGSNEAYSPKGNTNAIKKKYKTWKN